MTIQLLAGDCRDVLPTLAADSVHTVVTSPPYYGLRDYGTALWDGGDASCDHQPPPREVLPPATVRNATFRNNATTYLHQDVPGRVCRCGAVRIDRQIGSEPTPDEYLATMVAVFREIRRVLRSDGTVWCNLGDSYASNPSTARGSGFDSHRGSDTPTLNTEHQGRNAYRGNGVKPKDLLLMPARLALALQAPQHYGPIAKETDRAWMAAFMDGEGTISIARNVSAKSRGGEEYCQVGYTPFVSAGNQDVELIERIVAITGCGKVGLKDRPTIDARQIRSRRDYYGWRVDAKLATAIIRDIYPFLIAKRKQAILAYNLALSNEQGRSLRGNGALPKSEQEKRERLKLLVNACNQRQPVDMPAWLIEPPSNVEQGWWVRSDIIIAKKNPMPESCRDRPTSAHEHVFLLTKSARYFFDPDAVREKAEATRIREETTWDDRKARGELIRRGDPGQTGHIARTATLACNGSRNIRNVWDISTEAFGGAHFATMPTSVVERCIRAGTSERGCCAACGKPWVRVTQATPEYTAARAKYAALIAERDTKDGRLSSGAISRPQIDGVGVYTTGWQPGCDHNADVVPCRVLDPFFGAGTTGLVAERLQRDCIGIDLNPDYNVMSRARIEADAPLFTSFPPAEPPEDERMGDLFQDMAAE